jgi:hypothetical protein
MHLNEAPAPTQEPMQARKIRQMTDINSCSEINFYIFTIDNCQSTYYIYLNICNIYHVYYYYQNSHVYQNFHICYYLDIKLVIIIAPKSILTFIIIIYVYNNKFLVINNIY